jgi:hypothetical protein
MKSEYDAIVSLGGFCAPAQQLRARGLRNVAMPFDWLYMVDESTVKWLVGAFANDFKDFCLKENLEVLTRNGTAGIAPFMYRDKASGYGFIHHFYKSLEDGGYEEFWPTMNRRMKRFLSLFRPGGSILLILATPFSFDLADADKLLSTIRGRHPDVHVDLYVMQFAVPFSENLVIAKRIDEGHSFEGILLARRQSTYDLHRTSYEWSFMDGLTIKGRQVKKPVGLTRMRMKLWKHLSLWLRDHNYGCVGIRY